MPQTEIYKKRGVDYRLKENLQTLPGKYYHSEEIYKEELEKIFYQRWLFVCREEEIPNPGDYLLFEIGDESIIVVRDEKGKLNAHFNVCRHRGTRICENGNGHFQSKTIQCPYHAWTYSLDGKLKGAPLMKELKNFDNKNFPLHSAHLKTWEGFVFINLSQKPKPFEKEMSCLIGKFGDWHLSELRIARKIEYNLNCNWKLILQNYQECYHCPGVHPLLCKLTPYRSAKHDCDSGAVIGGYMELTKKRGSMTLNGEAAAPPIYDVSGDDLQRVYYYSVFPNMLFTLHPDFVLYHRIVPKGNGKVQLHCHWLFQPDVIADSKHKDGMESAINFWDLTNKQDWQVCEQMQLGTKSKRFTRGQYAGQEDMLYALDKEILKSLGHTKI